MLRGSGVMTCKRRRLHLPHTVAAMRRDDYDLRYGYNILPYVVEVRSGNQSNDDITLNFPFIHNQILYSPNNP